MDNGASSVYMCSQDTDEDGKPSRCAERSVRCEPVPPGREDESWAGRLTLTTGRIGSWAGRKKPSERKNLDVSWSRPTE